MKKLILSLAIAACSLTGYSYGYIGWNVPRIKETLQIKYSFNRLIVDENGNLIGERIGEISGYFPDKYGYVWMYMTAITKEAWELKVAQYNLEFYLDRDNLWFDKKKDIIIHATHDKNGYIIWYCNYNRKPYQVIAS